MFKLLLKPILGFATVMSFVNPGAAFSRDQSAAGATEPEGPVAEYAVRDVASLEREWLSEHNKERARNGSVPLEWDKKLAAAAAAHAAFLAKNDIFEHSEQRAGSDYYGENLWMGTHGAYGATDIVGSWIVEGKDFVPGIFPNVSKTGNWADIGHYTQLIWPGTRRVGCALAGNARDEYVVCQYSPAGNILGEHIGVK